MSQEMTASPRFAVDRFGSQARIGLVYMASSTVMEPEMYAMAGDDVSIHTSRLTLPKVTVDGIDEMMRSPELETATRLVAQAPLDVVCFGGTSASFLHGTEWDRSLIRRMTDWTGGMACTTTSTASVAALGALGAGTIALVTPYREEIVERARSFFSDEGHRVVAASGMGITSDQALAEVTPQQVYDAALATDSDEASAVFISCTNLRSIAVIAALEERLQKPVVSAVQASFWHCMQLVGNGTVRNGYGRLFEPMITRGQRAVT
jgi:maleate isomerase